MTSIRSSVLPRRTSRLATFKRYVADGRFGAVVLFVPPALLLFTIFVALPMADALYYSFFDWSGYGTPTDFVGSRNFEFLAQQTLFHQALWNSIRIVLASLLIQLPLALILALLIYEKRWSNTVFRLIFFLPYILAEVAAGLIWSFMFDGDYGIASMIGRSLGQDPVFLLADRTWAFYVILGAIVWKYFGLHMMIYIAGLQNISSDLIEAATIDGASRWQITRYIKIPLLRPSIAISVFLSVLGALQLFDLIVPMTNGGPSNLTHSIVTYLYAFGMQRLKVGFGSAVSVVLFVLCLVFAFTYRRTVMKEGKN